MIRINGTVYKEGTGVVVRTFSVNGIQRAYNQCKADEYWIEGIFPPNDYRIDVSVVPHVPTPL